MGLPRKILTSKGCPSSLKLRISELQRRPVLEVVFQQTINAVLVINMVARQAGQHQLGSGTVTWVNDGAIGTSGSATTTTTRQGFGADAEATLFMVVVVVVLRVQGGGRGGNEPRERGMS